jgi:hypothetical protein
MWLPAVYWTFRGDVRKTPVTNYAGFGSGLGVLDGREISGTITYDTTLAPPDGNPDPNVADYHTDDDSVIWLPLIVFSIDGVEVPVPPIPPTILFSDPDQSIDLVNDGANDIFELSRDLDITGSNGQSMDYNLSLGLTGGDAFSDDSLPLRVDLSDFSGGTGDFGVFDSANNVEVQGTFDLNSLRLVPIPPAIVLFLSGFGLLLGMKYRLR